MKIQPVASPGAIQQAPSTAESSKARAIAAFEAANKPAAAPQAKTEQSPVLDQNNIAVEELGAIKAQTGQHDSIVEQEQQTTQEETTTEVEAPAEEAKPKEDPALSHQFAQLAKQEKALRAKAQQQDQALKAREAALQAREAELASKSQIDQTKYMSKDQFKRDPLSALAELGVSYEDLTNTLLSQQPTDPRVQNTISRLEAEIMELKQQNENSKKTAQEQQTAQYQAAVKQIESETRALVSKDPNFETIKATRSERDVVELIEKTYNEDGILLSVEEAAQQVEDYLVEEGIKIARIEKIKRKLSEVAPKTASIPAQKTAVQTQKQPQTMKTLTNATSSQRQLSAKERAILAFKGELKS